MSMKRFEIIKNAEDMDEYLESSANEIDMDNPIIYSHYTDIKCALNIFSSKTIWLSSYKRMNDLFEKEILDRSDKNENFFFISLSRAEESLAMYKMYGNKESSVVLKIPDNFFVCSIRNHLKSDCKNGADDDSRSGSYVRNVDLINYNNITIKNVLASLSMENVIYCDPYDNSLNMSGYKNTRIISPLKQNALAGHVKYKCWDYEQETRFCARIVDDVTKPIEKVIVKLPSCLCNEVRVVLGPGFNKEKYYNELIELRRLGVLYHNSVYDGFFKDTKYPKRFSVMRYYEEYYRKTFCGNDPWGGKLIITILYCDENKLELEWLNKFKDGSKPRNISKILELDLNDDLISQYDICCKLRINKNQNEYFSYSYSGTIQLVDGKVLVSFNSGECYSYLFGAAGSNSYCGGGSWRMGNNLLAILEESKA